MRLDRIELEGFRGIDRLSIDLDDLTTIIGEHDCGKSSLLRAVGRVLAPRAAEALPQFTTADFHRPHEDEESRATTLAITLGLRTDDDGDDLAEGLPGADDGGLSLRVLAHRGPDSDPVTTIDVIDRAGVPIEDIDGEALLARLRKRHPAVIVGGTRPSLGAPTREAGDRASRLRTVLLDAAGPREPLTWDQLSEAREDLVQAGGRLADQLGPTPEQRRSVLAMTDTPRALVTDLGSALEPGAGSQRRIAALWLLVSILDAVPEEGLGAEAEPILLFDDIEANLHPTWLAALASVALNLPFQQIVATHSPEVLAWVPLSSLRRLSRGADGIEARSVQVQRYSVSELRRLTFHVRLNRGGSFFARCWVLVEGETEAWLVPELARLAGVEFPVEGIRIIEFAQCGVSPLLKLADDLGIGWVVLTDGDAAGQNYARSVRGHLEEGGAGEVVVLPATDIEHYLFKSGYADVIKGAAGIGRTRSAGKIIKAAVEKVTKPGLALIILAAADERGSHGVPPVLRELAQTALGQARGD
jgi:putative ATP-dependent endonuclease of OLD family